MENNIGAPSHSLIPLHEENEQYPVNGRELWEKLNIGTEYAKWFSRSCEYGFERGKDYEEVFAKNDENTSGQRIAGRPSTNHRMTISMAKEICMLQRTEQGRAVRKYLIQVEEAWNSPDAIINRALKISAARVQTLTENVAKLESDNAALNDKIQQDAPKVYFAGDVSAADGDILIGDLAKLLHQNGLDIGRDRLFARLREDGYLIKGGKSRNLPTQKSVSCGLMRVRESLRATGNSNPNTFLTPVITGKGQRYFVHKYCYEPSVFAVQQ